MWLTWFRRLRILPLLMLVSAACDADQKPVAETVIVAPSVITSTPVLTHAGSAAASAETPASTTAPAAIPANDPSTTSAGTPAPAPSGPTATPAATAPAIEGLRPLLRAVAVALENADRDAIHRLVSATNGDASEALIGAAAHRGWPVATVTAEPAGDGLTVGSDRADAVTVYVWARLDGMTEADRLRAEATASFRREAGQWVVSAWQWREPPDWMRLPARPLRSAHFLMMVPDGVGESDARGALDELEAAHTRLSGLLPAVLFRPRYLVLYAPDGATFSRLSGGASEQTLGVAISQYAARVVGGEPVGLDVFGIRIILNGDGVRFYQAADPLFGREATLRHELVHAVLAPWTRAWTPGWLAEGTAMLFAEQPLWSRLLSLEQEADLAAFLTTTSFRQADDPSGELTGRDYALAGALATFVVDWWGSQALLDLYRAYADAPLGNVTSRTPVVSTPTLNAAALDAVAADLTPGILSRVLVGVTSPAVFLATFNLWWAEQQGR